MQTIYYTILFFYHVIRHKTVTLNVVGTAPNCNYFKCESLELKIAIITKTKNIRAQKRTSKQIINKLKCIIYLRH